MKKSKAYYQSIIIDGYTWGGYYGKGLHFFLKRAGNGYYQIKCTDEDIDDGNLKDMIKLALSR